MTADRVLISAKLACDDKTEVLRCIGRWLRAAGIDTVFMARQGSNPKAVKSINDDGFQAALLKNLSDFYPTVAEFDAVIFGEIPGRLQLYWCRQNKTHSIVLGDVCNTSIMDIDVLKYATCCVLPTSSATIGWRKNDIHNSIYLPVIPRAAVPREDYEVGPDSKILLPLWGPLAHRIAFTALSLVERYLHASKDGSVVVGYTPSTLHPEAKKRCRRLRKKYGRLVMSKACSVEEQLIAVRDSDLVLFPAIHDKYGWVPALALLTGVPVLGNASDMNQEILSDTSSILLEPAKVSRSSLNNDLNEPDYEAFDECLQKLASGEKKIPVSSESSMRALRIRNKFFDSGMFRIMTLGA